MSERTAMRTISDALEYVAKNPTTTKWAIVIVVDHNDNLEIKWSAGGRQHDFIGALEITKTVFMQQNKMSEAKHIVPSGDTTLN